MSDFPYAWFVKASLFITVIFSAAVVVPDLLWARNINQYKDTISNSAPGQPSNHTLSFVLNTSVGPGAYMEFIPPRWF